jgi:hypothetical protein
MIMEGLSQLSDEAYGKKEPAMKRSRENDSRWREQQVTKSQRREQDYYVA